MFDIVAFQTGAMAFILAFAVAGAFTIAFKLIYQVCTPYNEPALIREGNLAAAVALWGAILGYVLPLASALSHTVSLAEFIAWAVLAAIIQILVMLVVRHFAIKDLKHRIEKGDLSAAIYLAGVSLTVGLINAACITD